MNFFKWHKKELNQFKNNPKIRQEYHKTAHHMTLQAKIAAGISMISIIGLAGCLLCLTFNIITWNVLILGAILLAIFIISSMRMVHLIIQDEQDSETKSNHK